MSYSIAQIVVGLPVAGPFDYFIPENLRQQIKVGSRVYVSFRLELRVGYVIGLQKKTKFPRNKLKTIISCLDNYPTLDERFLNLTKKISEHYVCSWGEAIEVALPSVLRTKKEVLTTKPQTFQEKTENPAMELALGSIHTAASRVAQKIKSVFLAGKSVLFLVPEVGQVSVVRDFLEKVCEVSVAVFDRRLGAKDELSQWLSVKEGKIRVVVGTRSAVFTMMPALGLIVLLDEENTAYKQEPAPFYHCRDVALMRQKLEGCDLLFVTPTPTAELWKTLKDKKARIELFSQTNAVTLQLIDQTNYKYQNMLISFPLQNHIQDTLLKGGKVLLFLNRRGFSTMTKCNQCGFVIKCARCNTNLSYLFSKKKMICTRCNTLSVLPKMCPQCQSSYLRSVGTGIEKLESDLVRIYPAAKSAVFDSESRVFDNEANLMVATQAVMPFLHRSHFNLIAVLDFDSEINRPDFRASVRAFSILSRLRSAAKERMFVQTRHLKHDAIRAVIDGKTDRFYSRELALRKNIGLPPYVSMVLLAMRGPREEAVFKNMQELYERLHKEGEGRLEISVPQPDLRPKLRDQFRFTIMLKGKSVKSILKVAEPVFSQFHKHKDIILTVDVNP